MVELHPFAGVVEESFDFTDGMNLIIGPNEAGKSTLFNAITHGLLTTTNLTEGKLNDIMGDYFPVNGGDVIRVTIEFYLDDPDQVYLVKKEWKKGNRAGSASLIKPDQSEMTNEEAIQQFLNGLLPVQPATMRQVFLAKQSGLHEVFSNVQESDIVRNDIGTILRKSVMETGGISVDRFKKRIDDQFEYYFNNWNREKEYPKPDGKGHDRGIQRPHAQKVGDVLQAWYDMKNAEQKLTKITEFENELDRLEQEFKALEGQKIEKKKQLQEYKSMLDQLNRREALESQLSAIDERFDRIKEITKKWPIYENDLKKLTPKLEKLEKQLEVLNEEQKKASQLAEMKELQKRVHKLESLQKELIEARSDVEESTPVTESDLDALRNIRSEIQTSKARIEASKLALRIEAKHDAGIKIQGASGEGAEVEIKSGEKHEAVFEGLFKLETDEFTINVSAGEDDLSEISDKLQENQEQLNQKLESFGVESWDEVNSLHKLYADKVQKYNGLNQRYEEELGEDSIEELKKRLNEAGDLQGLRSIEEINRDRDKLLEEKSDLTGKAREMRDNLEKWKLEFEDMDAVFDKRSGLTRQKKEIENALQELPTLPEEFESVEEFRTHVNGIENDRNDLESKVQKVREELIRAEENVGDVSAEEQQVILNEKTGQYEKTLSKAESLAKVKEKTDALVSEIEQDTYEPLVEGLQKWMNRMSDGRFTSVELNEDQKEIPGSFKTENGVHLKPKLLSHGTKDLAGLAWKLAISEKYLADRSGLLLMDDPMVDMDPVRKKLAAKALGEFAEDQQILLFSCHPETEQLFSSANVTQKSIA